MKEGWWINTRTGKVFQIDEHERWLRRDNNADKLKISKGIQKSFSKFKPVKDRDEFLLYVMRKADAMRARGHGSYVTFEYHSRSKRDPMEAIWMWGLKNAGPMTGMYIVNFATNEKTSIRWSDFLKFMENDDPDGIMRVAHKFDIKPEVNAKIDRLLAGEILKVAEELL
jgi:hypothetical protein